MAMSKKPDGSTDKIYAQNGRDNNFQVIDFDTKKITQAVTLPESPRRSATTIGPPAPDARPLGHAGPEVAGDHQPVEQLGLQVFAARREALGGSLKLNGWARAG